MIREAHYYTGMAMGVYRLLRQPRTGDPMKPFLSQIQCREQSFLDMAREIVFADPRHPYHEMFRLAGCAYGDLEASVRQEGLESALRRLAEGGVYLTHDELKGKTPIVRAGRHIISQGESFQNPLVAGFMEGRSGGSRSRGTVTRQNPRHQAYRDVYDHLLAREFGLAGRTRMQLMPILPSTAGLTSCLRLARMGRPASAWFSVSGAMRDSGHYRAVTRFMVLLARAMGARVPRPRYLPQNDFSPAVRWLAERRAEGKAVVVAGFLSPQVRVAAAAAELGLDIRGTLFLAGGEALTEKKRQTIEATGSEVFPSYWISELGPVGFACRQMRSGNSVHVMKDSIAVISRRRKAPLCDQELDSLLFTSLLPFAPRFLINAEMDDTGVIEPSRCRCAFSEAGMTTQISGIASYGKLTGQGITIYGTDVVEILEAALPARFGGAPGDYQLVEKESGNQTQVELRVSPRAGAVDAESVRQYFVGELRRRYGGALAVRTWQHTDAVGVVIAEPIVTASGKVLPLHLLGRGDAAGHAS